MGEYKDKSHRGNASQFFVAGELCRRGYAAAVTMGNCPNTDILCSNKDGTKFVHIQVKTFVPGGKTCSVGMKSQIDYGPRFFWVLGGIPKPGSSDEFSFYIIPSRIMAKNVKINHALWSKTPGKGGKPHDASTTVRTVHIPPHKGQFSWSIKRYENAWNLIEAKLEDE